MKSLSRSDVEEHFRVSRETMHRLDTHVHLLNKWNPRINLVSRDSLAGVWHRHVADSAQLWLHCPKDCRVWLDLGSGGGFPGLVVAAFATGTTDLLVRLVEADARKAAFLAEVVRRADLQAEVVNERIESLPVQMADVVSARALAPLSTLLDVTSKLRRQGGIGLFPKGRTVHKELDDASRAWRFEARIHPSLTDAEAGIVEIGALNRV